MNIKGPLEGSAVSLEPIDPRHRERLWQAAQFPEIWGWLANIGASATRFHQWFDTALAATKNGYEGVFVTIDRSSRAPLGSTRYLNARRNDRVVEIGWTWLTPAAWRTGANIEAKLLMLEHAFTQMQCVRVEFKTDARNQQSRRALAALPAQFEGVLRNHMIVPDIGLRDSAYYSILDNEWPQVQNRLRERIANHANGTKRD
jgi:RimJ/RimL family protein N-acetyltransferase